jgi:hypothetical protein
MQWIKQNLVIVILIPVMLIALVAGWLVSSGMNTSIRESQQAAAEDAQREISGATVTYVVPAAMPGQEPVELRSAPNDRLTAWFARERERVESEAAAVREDALAFNRRGHDVFVEGLFPEPASAARGARQLNLFKRIMVGGGEEPSFYERTIDGARGGARSDHGRLFAALEELRSREVERLRLESGSTRLSDEDQARLTQRLSDRRLSEYRRRGREISFYADPSLFFQDSGRGATVSVQWPNAEHARQLDAFYASIIQWDAWVIRDIFDAIALANAQANGQPTPIDSSVVKRVTKLSIDQLPVFGEDALVDSQSEAVSQGGLAPMDPGHSVTGRLSTAENSVYSVRTVTLEAIVSTARLPAFLRALRQTNFMTVVDLDLAPVDSWADLQDGYYYGDEHVAKATFTIETVWLHGWLAPLLHPDIRGAMGIELPEPEDDFGDD